jgi:hypothetical protein
MLTNALEQFSIEHLSAVFCPLTSDKRLRPAGARYNFCQDSMNFFQQAAGLHASGK